MNLFLNLFSGILGATFIAFIAHSRWREETFRYLLSEAMAIQGQKEAYILVCEKFEKNFSLHQDSPGRNLDLLEVELRFVLDEAQWNFYEDNKKYSPCKLLDNGRRGWIVRDTIKTDENGKIKRDYEGVDPEDSCQALLSSKAREELWAWIEKVASARAQWRFFRSLSDEGLFLLNPLLGALDSPNRIKMMNELYPFSDRAQKLLNENRGFVEKYKKKL